MTAVKLLMAAAALLLIAGPASAVTVKNTSNAEISVGVDWGNKEKVETVRAGKSVTFECRRAAASPGPGRSRGRPRATT